MITDWTKMMTIIQTHRDGDTRCNNHIPNCKINRCLGKCLIVIEKRLNSLAVQDTSFSTSVTLGLLPIVTCCEKDFLGGAVWHLAWDIFVLGDWYDTFLSFGLKYFGVWPNNTVWRLSINGDIKSSALCHHKSWSDFHSVFQLGYSLI